MLELFEIILSFTAGILAGIWLMLLWAAIQLKKNFNSRGVDGSDILFVKVVNDALKKQRVVLNPSSSLRQSIAILINYIAWTLTGQKKHIVIATKERVSYSILMYSTALIAAAVLLVIRWKVGD
ncbi:hypothetical protein CN610_19900 [Bacillus wiedmannii]|nr:hypothetical protein CN610_19900 [Bacillus wiedmannii]